MGIMDKLKGMLSGNKDQVNKGIDTAADKTQDATGQQVRRAHRHRRGEGKGRRREARRLAVPAGDQRGGEPTRRAPPHQRSAAARITLTPKIAMKSAAPIIATLAAVHSST